MPDHRSPCSTTNTLPGLARISSAAPLLFTFSRFQSGATSSRQVSLLCASLGLADNFLHHVIVWLRCLSLDIEQPEARDCISLVFLFPSQYWVQKLTQIFVDTGFYSFAGSITHNICRYPFMIIWVFLYAIYNYQEFNNINSYNLIFHFKHIKEISIIWKKKSFECHRSN